MFTAPAKAKDPRAVHPINQRVVLSHLKAVVKSLGLKGHLHTFRHSFISHALVRGVPEAVVRQWVGHVDAQILKLYTHIADQDSQRYMSRLFDPVKPVANEQAALPIEAPAHEAPADQING